MLQWPRITKFFIISLVVFSFLLILLYPKGLFVLVTNISYTKTSVICFRVINMLGDGVVFAYIGVIAALVSFRKTIFLLFLILIQTLLVRGFKDGIANGFPRPVKYFSEIGIELQVGQLVDIHLLNSFPSGHATTAFTIGLFSLLLIENKKWQIPIFSLFCISAFARVYLAQHFFIDIAAGLYLALFTFLLSEYFYNLLKVYKVKGSILSIIVRSLRLKEPTLLLKLK